MAATFEAFLANLLPRSFAKLQHSSRSAPLPKLTHHLPRNTVIVRGCEQTFILMPPGVKAAMFGIYPKVESVRPEGERDQV